MGDGFRLVPWATGAVAPRPEGSLLTGFEPMGSELLRDMVDLPRYVAPTYFGA